jgi:nucleotide-binding universal stress UspA family protein
MSAYRTVVVGTDGSDSSMRAVDKAAQIAGSDAKLIVASAYLPQHENGRAADILKE